MRSLLHLTLLTFLGGWLAAAALANLPIEFSAPVRTIVQVEPAPSVRCTSVHVVQEGETLETIAQAQLGSKARAPEIVAHNPHGLTTPLKPGTRLIVPPARVLFHEGTPVKTWTLCLYGTGYSPFDNAVIFQPYATGEAFPDSRAGISLVAIRTDMLPHFWGRVATQEPPKDAAGQPQFLFFGGGPPVQVLAALTAAKVSWIARTPKLLAGRTRAVAGDPVHTIRETYRLTSIHDGALGLERTARKLFDKQDKEISPEKAQSTKEKLDLLLLLLGGGGMFGLLLVAARRMRTVRTSAA